MMKRIIALLLALILTVGLLPTVALAAGETGADTAPADVIDGYYDDNNEWTKGELKQSAVPGVQTVSKTAKPTANPNEYEVTLKVVLKQTSETKTGAAATALVLDCSGSMDWCTECGQDWCRHKTDDTYNVTFDVHNSNSYYVIENGKYVRVSYCDGYHFLSSCDGGAGWYTSDRKRDHKSQNKLTPKISQTDSAATHVQFYTRTEGSFDTSRMTAAKNAAKNFLKTYSGFDASVIKDDGSLKDTAKDLSIKRYVAVIRFSNNIDNDTDSSSWWEGEDYKPAWYDVSTVVGYNKVLATINHASAGGGTNLDAGLTTASSLMDADLVKNLTSKNVIALTDGAPTYSKSYGDGGSTNQDICNETAKTAETLRVKSKVYTVCFAAESESLYDGGGTVGNFLKERIATQPAEGSNEKYAYNAKSAEDLIKVFKDITDTIVSGLNNGTVKDSLPTGITSTDFGNATQFELNDQKQFHKDVKTETVDGKEVTTYTYTKTYTVKIDPKTVKTEKVDGVDYAPLNGETTLTVKNSAGENVTIHFPIPAGKVTMPSYTVTGTIDNNGAVTGSGQTVNAGGSSAAMTFTPAAGYKIISVKEKVGEVETTITDFAETGYTYPVKNDIRANITVDVKTAKRSDLSYTVRYLEKGTTNEIRTADTVNGQEFSATITGDSINHPAITGFIYDSCSPESITIGTDSAQNVITLYYTRNSYTVTFKDGANGAVFEDETQQVEYGKAIPSHADPVRPGYNFTGWTSEPANYQPGTGTMPANNITFTAQWTEKGSVTINYVAKTGGSVTLASETLNPDTGEATGSTATAEPNYRFVGWYSDSECTEANKVSGEVTFTPPKPDEGGWVTTTYYAKFVPSTVTFDLNTLITKTFEKDPTRESKDIPTGTYIFTAQIFEADDTWQQVGEIPVYTGTATLNGAASGAAFDFGSSSNPTLASGTHRYLVKEEHGGETTDGITYDSTVYRLTITVSEDGTQPNVQIEAEPQASVLSVQSVEFTSKIIFTNTYFEEKDPNALYLDFSKYVQKELTATGSKTASDVKFRVIVNGMESPIMMYNAGEEEVSTYVEFNPRYRTVLDVNFASITGGNTETKDFTGSYVEIDQVGIYYFELNEEDGKRTGVTYDDSTYKVYVYVKREGDKLVVDSFDIYKDGWSVAGETITFHNTIDTGRDDYIPIIIPTIINKDTGMLNKTDHFAYVIGYPDGTVHPNGQITRAEVATIFFRLLRDEVRDGAFTTSNTYSDVAYGKWYNNPISTMSALGIITGYPDGTFKPNKPITRAEFAAIAARFDETQSGKSATFSDVIGHWAAKEIGIAYANEWIKGYPDGTFKPDQNITRAEAMTMFNRVLERKPESPADLLTNMNKWTDNMDTSKWYYLDVQEATNSHAYTRKTFNYELWRQMLNDPDWSRYER